jgi:hyperosmotically inducible periplasmic protein
MDFNKQRSFPILLTVLFIAAQHLGAQAPDTAASQEELYKVANQIRKSLVTLNNFGVFDYLSFGLAPGANGYKVTLKGYASRPTLKDSAERVVKKLEHVESVDNQIEVLPLSPNDDRIRTAAYAKIYGNPVLSRYNPNRGVPIYGIRTRAFVGITNDPPLGPHPIHIIVKNGNIILEGVVDNEGDKNIAGIQANTVPGAFSVTNNLVVPPSKKK